MAIYSKKSLETLKERIDLVEVISPYLELRSAGAFHKGLCPFHEEKTPSFMIQKGSSHYHCFGCGAHGDAIAFLMSYQNLSFADAIESLAEKFGVTLEQIEWEKKEKGVDKGRLKEVLKCAASFYHFSLLYTDEGHQALQYLYNRGIDLNFIQLFHIGYAPRQGDLFEKIMQKDKVSMEELEIVGLIKKGEGNQRKLFFSDRITFPILDPFGNVIGFSARKIKEENFGPKYINTPETPLFKKSSVLYGLSFSRRRIAKEKKAIIVEGQIDALRLIHSGLNLTVAGQGTAFTEEHIKELLHLGITHVYLAFDGDEAGQNAALKVGDIFQKEGVEVSVAVLPQDSDPDTFLNEEGVEGFLQLLEKAPDYLAFAFELLSKNVNLHSPSEKNTLIQMLAKRIRNWDHPLMVHESLRKLAKMTQIPEELVGVGKEEVRQKIFIKKEGSIGEMEVDPDRVLEIDLLRWLFLLGERSSEIIQIIEDHIAPKHFSISICRHLYTLYMENRKEGKGNDLLTLANNLESVEEQLLFSEIMQKKVNTEKAKEGVIETVQKILDRYWLEEREKVRITIQKGGLPEEEILKLAKQFDALKRSSPILNLKKE